MPDLTFNKSRQYKVTNDWCIIKTDFIMKTCPCNVYSLKPHFYIAKLGYTGVYLFFLFLLPFLLQNIDWGYSLEPPRHEKTIFLPMRKQRRRSAVQ